MISVHEAENLSFERISAFLEASEEICFQSETREQVYVWIEQNCSANNEYAQQGRKARGLLRRYLEKMTGLSRA